MASDARDQLAEHLKFYAELGVTGYSKDPAWQGREQRAESKEQEPVAQGSSAVAQGFSPVSTMDDGRSTMDDGRSTMDDLAAIRADIGDCTRCKLCKAGRKQI